MIQLIRGGYKVYLTDCIELICFSNTILTEVETPNLILEDPLGKYEFLN